MNRVYEISLTSDYTEICIELNCVMASTMVGSAASMEDKGKMHCAQGEYKEA